MRTSTNMTATVTVNLGPRTYPIYIERSGVGGFTDFLRSHPLHRSSAIVVTDSQVEPIAHQIENSLALAGLKHALIVVPAGEESKSLAMTEFLYDRFIDFGAYRATLIIAVGGGVIGDLAGFAAATFNRGLPLMMVPTTLLAMVDSSVGGKVGVNHARGKNLIGAFHQPERVWINLQHLATLPEREYRSGLAEVIKYGMILDPELFSFLELNLDAILNRDESAVMHIIQRSCELKAEVVQQDEREEKGLRHILNYGHTFAHAFETISGYGTWLHGEAVAAGMVVASRLAARIGMIPPEVTDRQMALLSRAGLPVAPHPEWDCDAILAIMRHDKKNKSGSIRLVLPNKIGAVELVDQVSDAMILEALSP